MAVRGLTEPDRTRRGQVALAALCFLLTGLSAVFFARWVRSPDTGLVVMYPEVTVRDGSVTFAPRAPFSAAAAAGLRPGRDRIIAVDGVEVHSSRDVLLAHGRIRTFEPFPVEVERDGARVIVPVTPVFVPSRPDWVFVLAFCVVLAVTAALLTWRMPRSPGTALLVIASLLYLVFTCVKPFYYESLLANCLVQAGKLAPWLLVFFGLYFPFPRGTPATRAAVIGALLLGWAGLFAARIGLYSQWAASGAEAALDRYRQLGRIVNTAEGASYVAWGALMASAYFRARTQKEKAQLRWILAGILVALPPYFFFDQLPLILRHPGARVSLGNLAQLFLSFIPVCTLIGLTRHRVFSLRFFLSRVFVGAAVIASAGILFGLAWQPLRDSLAAGWGLAPAAAGFASAGVLFVALFPLRWAFARIADFAVRPRRGPAPSDLERKNAELQLLVEELGRQEAHTLRGRALSELRAVLRGVVRGLQEPSRQLSAALISLRARIVEAEPAQERAGAEAALAPAVQAGARIAEVLRVLESLAGPVSSSPTRAEAATLALAAVQRMRQKRPGAALALDCRCPGTVSCHPEELVNALCELLDNALDAQEGLPQPVRVRLFREDGRAVFEVEDDGPGLAPGPRRGLFAPFSSARPGHQGLGLYVARLVVERNDGSLDLGPGVDGGARARVVLPLEGA
jgi:signal transduction histidine kinase